MTEKGIISVRIDKKKWLEFAIKLKRERKKVADVIEPFIEDYIKEESKFKKFLGF